MKTEAAGAQCYSQQGDGYKAAVSWNAVVLFQIQFLLHAAYVLQQEASYVLLFVKLHHELHPHSRFQLADNVRGSPSTLLFFRALNCFLSAIQMSNQSNRSPRL